MNKKFFVCYNGDRKEKVVNMMKSLNTLRFPIIRAKVFGHDEINEMCTHIVWDLLNGYRIWAVRIEKITGTPIESIEYERFNKAQVNHLITFNAWKIFDIIHNEAPPFGNLIRKLKAHPMIGKAMNGVVWGGIMYERKEELMPNPIIEPIEKTGDYRRSIFPRIFCLVHGENKIGYTWINPRDKTTLQLSMTEWAKIWAQNQIYVYNSWLNNMSNMTH